MNKKQRSAGGCNALMYGDFTLASGKKSQYYIDIKKASTDPYVLEDIAEDMDAEMKLRARRWTRSPASSWARCRWRWRCRSAPGSPTSWSARRRRTMAPRGSSKASWTRGEGAGGRGRRHLRRLRRRGDRHRARRRRQGGLRAVRGQPPGGRGEKIDRHGRPAPSLVTAEEILRE